MESDEVAEVGKGKITQGFVALQHGGQTDQSFDLSYLLLCDLTQVS